MSDHISFQSTSASTAIGSPIILRETTSTRLVYVPLILENPNNASATVKGEFKYQRKNASDQWDDFETIPLTSVRSGEGYKLVLDSSETLVLFQKLSELYSFVGAQGIPMGTTRLMSVSEGEILFRVKEMLDANRVEGLLSAFVSWARSRNIEEFADVLEMENGAALVNFDAVIGSARLQNFLNEAKASLKNGDEAIWQDLLVRNSWAISQIYAYPAIIVQERAYVGGKDIGNTGGTLVDFLYRNSLTNNALIIEIKKPNSDLMNSSEYRNNVHAPSSELSGATLQTLNSRETLLRQYQSLISNEDPSFKIFSPKSLLVIGSLPENANELKSFEIYRNSLAGIEIVTFDELIGKVQQLLDLLNQS